MTPDTFADVVVKRLLADVRKREQAVGAGSAQTPQDYGKMCGHIAGLKDATRQVRALLLELTEPAKPKEPIEPPAPKQRREPRPRKPRSE